MNNGNYYGYLTVNVTTAIAAIPLADATVTVSRVSEGVDTPIAVLKTDVDGKTEKLRLQTPPPSNSLTPTPSGPSYALYNINARKSGYYPSSSLNVPVFANVTSIQPMHLLPYIVGRESDYAPGDNWVTEGEKYNLSTPEIREEKP